MFSTKTIDRMEDYSRWTALSNDTTNLASSVIRITGNYSLEFDKANGAANGTTAGASREIVVNLDGDAVQLHDKLQWSIYISALTNVASCYVKLGTDSTNNLQWTVDDSSLGTGWTVCTGVIGEPSTVNGNGWDPTKILYMEVGVVFDAETDTLADIKVDAISVIPSRYSEDNTEISMDGVSLNVDTSALETINTNILTSVQLIDDAVGTQDSAAPAGVLNVGGEYESTLSEMDSGDIAAIAIDAYRRVINSNYDASTGTGLVTDNTTLNGVPFTPAVQTTLTAPGDGQAVNVSGYHNITVQVKVVLNTCTNVVVRADGSLDGTNYGNVEGSMPPVATTITADGTYFLTIPNTFFSHIKPVFVSEATNTDSTVTFTIGACN